MIRSIARMNYLVTGADQDIDKIAQSLSRIEGQVLNLLSTQTKASIRESSVKFSRVGYDTTNLADEEVT